MWLNNVCGWHKNKANMVLHIIAGILILYGSFMYSWQLTVLAIVLAAIGHFVQYAMESSKNSRLMKPMPKASKKKKR